MLNYANPYKRSSDSGSLEMVKKVPWLDKNDKNTHTQFDKLTHNTPKETKSS